MDKNISIDEKRQDIADILYCYTQLGWIRKKQAEEQMEIIKEKYKFPHSGLELKIRYAFRQLFNVFLSIKDMGQFADYESYKQYALRHGVLPETGLTFEGRCKLEAYKALYEDEDHRIETYAKVIQAVNSSEETALKTWQAAYAVRNDGGLWFIMHSIVTGSGVKPSYDVSAGAFNYHTTNNITKDIQPVYDKLREKLEGLGAETKNGIELTDAVPDSGNPYIGR